LSQTDLRIRQLVLCFDRRTRLRESSAGYRDFRMWNSFSCRPGSFSFLDNWNAAGKFAGDLPGCDGVGNCLYLSRSSFGMPGATEGTMGGRIPRLLPFAGGV